MLIAVFVVHCKCTYYAAKTVYGSCYNLVKLLLFLMFRFCRYAVPVIFLLISIFSNIMLECFYLTKLRGSNTELLRSLFVFFVWCLLLGIASQCKVFHPYYKYACQYQVEYQRQYGDYECRSSKIVPQSYEYDAGSYFTSCEHSY